MDVASKPTDNSGERPDICLIELGGTVGDIESAVYLEALQQLQFKMGPDHFLTVHLGWVPFQNATGEQKTKPCQHSVKTMREAGLKPDLLICRSQEKISSEIRQKLSLFCQVRPNEVISLHDCTNIFRVPMLLAEQKVGDIVLKFIFLFIMIFFGSDVGVEDHFLCIRVEIFLIVRKKIFFITGMFKTWIIKT